MSWRELIDWHRFEATVSPLPDKLADLHWAIVSSLIVNATRSAASEPVAPRDFLIISEPPPAFDDEDDGRTEAERAAATWRGGS